jgi:hypothetical protein
MSQKNKLDASAKEFKPAAKAAPAKKAKVSKGKGRELGEMQLFAI